MRMHPWAATALLTLAAACAPAEEAAANETIFAATRDVRIPFDPSEMTFNFGQAPRLRARALEDKSAEVVLIDFERAAIAAFLDAHRRDRVAAYLVVYCRDVLNTNNATVEVVALDSASEWTEGTQEGAPAPTGEVNSTAARFGAMSWTDATGRTVADVRAVFYDQDGDRFLTPVNAHALQLSPADKGQPLRLQLDAKFLDHFARSPVCKGLVLCTRSNVIADFSSREQFAQEPRIVLTVAH